MKKILALATVLAVIAGGWFWWRAKAARAPAAPAREVVVVRGDIRETALATGTVEPQNRVELASPVPGRIDDVLVREGDRVERGQTLALVSSTERATLLDAARARGPEELARWERFYNPTPVIAPLNGTVIARLLEPGQSVSPDKPILVLSDRLTVRAQVDETDLARISLGQRAEIRLDAYPHEALAARVAHIAYESRTVNNVVIYNVEIAPDDLPPFVRSGMSAGVTFVLRATNNVLVLPADALRGTGSERTALVAAAPKRPPEVRAVKVGIDDGRHVEILGGLAEGDRVLAPEAQLGAAGAQKSTPLLPFGGGGARRRM
jgi:macrolide-specific efflux system membrane fusion protein